MEYQTIKKKGKVKYVVLPIELFENLLDRLEDVSDLQAIHLNLSPSQLLIFLHRGLPNSNSRLFPIFSITTKIMKDIFSWPSPLIPI